MTSNDEGKVLRPDRRIRFQSNKLKTKVGVINEKNLRFLAFFQKCDRDTCPLSPSCPHKNKARCELEYNFLAEMYRDWTHPVFGLGDVLNQVQMDRIGTVIIPLYQLQLKLLKEIYLLPATGYVTEGGRMSTYPQYSSYFQAVKALTFEMKSLKLDEMWEGKFGDRNSMPRMKTINQIIRTPPRPKGYELAQGMIAQLAKQREVEKALNERNSLENKEEA